MPRTAETVFLGDAAPLIRAVKEAEAAVARAASAMTGANTEMQAALGGTVKAQAEFSRAATAAGDVAAKAAAKAGLATEQQAVRAGAAARHQAEAVGASALQQEAAYAKAADAARASA